MIIVVYALPHGRDNEKAYVTLNDKTCWTKAFTHAQGSQQCGSSRGHWLEDSAAVRCEADSVAGKLTVRVYTNLNSGAGDESFAIDNVDVRKVSSGMIINLVISDTDTHFYESLIYHPVNVPSYCMQVTSFAVLASG